MCFATIGCRSAKEGQCGSCIKGKNALEEQIAARFRCPISEIEIRRVDEFTIRAVCNGHVVAEVNRGDYSEST